jgi:hypothetical protein
MTALLAGTLMDDIALFTFTGSTVRGDQVPSEATLAPPSIILLVEVTEGAVSRIADAWEYG